MAGANKSRRGGVAEATATSSSKALRLRDAVSATKEYTVSATSRALVASLVRPMVLALVLLVLTWLALTFLGRFQLWMTAAGVLMVLLSVASAVQEFAHAPKAVQSYQDLLDEAVESCSADKISLPSMAPPAKPASVKAATLKSATPAVVSHPRRSAKAVAVDAHALNAASPAIVTNPVLLESGGVSELQPAAPKSVASSRRRKSEDCAALESAVRSRRRNSSSGASELANQLLVLHCGTVIDIEGSHGFLIPHDLGYDAGFKTVASKKKSKASAAAARQLKLPLVIPFDLNDDASAAAREELAVGRTVEFAFSERTSDCRVCALNVTPVASDGEIERSRHALLTCKQAREQSFARAMCDLKMISPRNEPVKHVDLIKYAAEQLDDHELAFEQFI